MAYTPDWERLADALQRVMAAGASEDESKLDLCRAVADGKIRVRVRIAGSGNRVFSGGNVRVPPILGPAISIGHGHAHWRNGISDQNSASIIIGTEAQKHSI